MTKTTNIYSIPIPSNTTIKGVYYQTPSHVGPYEGAVDIAVDIGTEVLAPFDGVIVEMKDSSEKYGETEDYATEVNFLTIKHTNGEYSQFLHLAKDSSLVKVGHTVKKGQKVAETGLSGWMTAPHLHWIVFKLEDTKEGFVGLEIRTNEDMTPL
jgi:murein DD-endopeptidase MepM/ murein hydrolase activator NlpD